MYGYRTKRDILDTYFKWENEQPPHDTTAPMLVEELCKLVRGKNATIRWYILNMQLEGYFEFINLDRNDTKVIITPKGITAKTGEYFKIKQHNSFWKAFRDISLTATNII